MNQRGLGQTYPPQPSYGQPAAAPAQPISPQWLATSARLPQDQIALAQAQVSGNTTAYQAAQAQVAADMAIMQQGPYAVAAPAAPATNNTPYIIAGVIGVVVVGALIYVATK